jgi:hypothetical protein
MLISPVLKLLHSIETQELTTEGEERLREGKCKLRGVI